MGESQFVYVTYIATTPDKLCGRRSPTGRSRADIGSAPRWSRTGPSAVG